MIFQTIKNSAPKTKIHAMMHGRLFIKDYIELSRLSSVSEVAAFLKDKTNYKSVLNNTDIYSIQSIKLENILKLKLQEDIKSLFSFCPAKAKFILKIFIIKEDINNLKILLRYLFSENLEEYYKKENFTFNSFPPLKKINNLSELVEALKNSPYYGALKPFINFPKKQNPFEIETALDMCYNRLCRKILKKFSDKNDIKILKHSFGVQSDLEVLMFIIRLKKYYFLSPKQIYPYITPNPYILKNSDIKSMVLAQSTEEIFNIIKKTPYKTVFSKDLNFFENNVNKYILKVHRDLYRKNKNYIAYILFFIISKEIEIKNVTTIIEAIRYGLSSEESLKHLII